MQSQPLQSAQEPPDSDELSRFREAWKAEVRKKKATLEPEPSASGSNEDKDKEQTQPIITSHRTPASPQQAVVGPSTSHTSEPAVGIYRQAVQFEQRGQHNDALRLYRQAFRMDPSVDRIYHREEILTMVQSPGEKKQTHERNITSEEGVKHMESLITAMQPLAIKSQGGDRLVTGTLSDIVARFPSDLAFQPENEKEPVLISTIPQEVLALALGKLDPIYIERFASVCRMARVIALDTGIWKELVERIYRPPMVAQDFLTAVMNKHLFDYRRVFIEYPRLRLDGVYISFCHYTRPGLSENVWVNLSHLVTYYRYFLRSRRFYPDGQVLSLLTNEELPPQQVISAFKPSLRMKGFLIGNWTLDSHTVHISNLVDHSGKFTHSPSPTKSQYEPHHHKQETRGHAQLAMSEAENARYMFQMTLRLQSKPLGRWNKLEMFAYDSISLETADVVPITLKHERPFWFSRVRSYV